MMGLVVTASIGARPRTNKTPRIALLALASRSQECRASARRPTLRHCMQKCVVICPVCAWPLAVRFSNRPFEVKRVQTIHCHGVDVARELALSLRNRHHGPSSMEFEDEVEQSEERPCHQTLSRSKRTDELTSSIVPRGTSSHRSVEFE
jgi:hypothetical protein